MALRIRRHHSNIHIQGKDYLAVHSKSRDEERWASRVRGKDKTMTSMCVMNTQSWSICVSDDTCLKNHICHVPFAENEGRDISTWLAPLWSVLPMETGGFGLEHLPNAFGILKELHCVCTVLRFCTFMR